MLWLPSRMQLWDQLGVSLRAGFTVQDALAQAARMPGSAGRLAGRLLASGAASLGDMVAACPGFFSETESAIVKAGEMSGTLPESLGYLRDHLKVRRMLALRIATQLAYPLLISHMSAVAGVVAQSMGHRRGGTMALDIVLILLPLYAFTFALFVLPGWVRRMGDGAACAVDRFMARLPLAGAYFRTEAENELYWMLGTMLRAGIGIREAVAFAVEHLTDRALRDALGPVEAATLRGEPLGEALASVPGLTPSSVARVATAETAGELPEKLLLLAREAQDAGDLTRRGVAWPLVTCYYLIMAAYAAWAILGFWLPLITAPLKVR